MKLTLRILFGIAGVLFLVVAGAILCRTWLLDRLITNALDQQGLENVELTVSEAGFSGMRIEQFTSGKAESQTQLRIDLVEIDWTISGLQNRSVDSLSISGVTGTVEQTEDGWVIAGMPLLRPESSNTGGGSIKLGDLKLSESNITLESRSGTASISLQGEYNRATGGSASADVKSSYFGSEDLKLVDSAIIITAAVTPEREFKGKITADANVQSEGARYSDITLSADFSGSDFIALATDRNNTEADMVFNLSAPDLPLDVLAPVENYIELVAGHIPAVASINAGAHLHYQNGVLILENQSEDYFAIKTDTGIELSFSAPSGTRLLEWSSIVRYLNFNYDVSGLKLSPATGSISLLSSGTDPWTIDSVFTSSAWDDTNFSLVPGRVTYSGTIENSKLEGDTLFSGGATRLQTNNTQLQNLLVDGEFSLSADLQKRQAIITVPKGCITVDRPKATTRNGAFELRNAAFCPPSEGPIVLQISQNSAGEIMLDADGILSATRFDAKIGATDLSGVPPAAQVNLKIRNRIGTAATSIQGGSLNLNNRINFKSITGAGQATYRDGDIMLGGKIYSLTLADLSSPVSFSPLNFGGSFTIREASSVFGGNLTTPTGINVSAIEGTYDLKTGSGDARATFSQSNLVSLALQPASILPLLKGFVENASGSMAGQVLINFDKNRVQTRADMSLQDFTFSGPTTAVTQTAGLNLNARFESLSPLKTEGTQTATIDLIDLDALKLERGEILFDAPGDETLRIQSAIWPWFGGTLGIYSGTIPLNGDRVTIPLEVKDIDMKELLEFLAIDGLSGEGKLEGILPIVVEQGEARIDDGKLRASQPGNLRYQSAAIENAAIASGEAGKLAFDALSSFDFKKLELSVNGSLSGEIQVGVVMEGNSDAVVTDAGINYNIKINAPLLGLRQQYQAQNEYKTKVLDDLSEQYGVELEFGGPQSVKPEQE